MAIRLRTVKGYLIALCAARSVAKQGDIYLDDSVHEALALKFRRDFASEDGKPLPYPELSTHTLIEQEESQNKNRAWWDNVYPV